MNRVLILSRPTARAGWAARCKAAGLSCEKLIEIPCLESNAHPVLTPRQTEVLRGMALGLRTKEIARRLRIGVKTVETHRQQLMARLKIRHVPGLVRYALKTGVLPPSWLLE
jgi:DNA-binding NarL/FixJ family response regulator